MTRGGFRLLRRTQTVRRTVEEVYLRDDIACGSAMCPACAHLESDHGHPPPLCADATHYAIPDARALAENVDAFLAAAVCFLAALLALLALGFIVPPCGRVPLQLLSRGFPD